MPVKTVTFGVSTTISAALLPPSTLLINLFSCHARSCFFMLSLSTCVLLYHSYFIAIFIAMFCFYLQNPGFHFLWCSAPANTPCLNSFSNGPGLFPVVNPFLSSSLCLYYMSTGVLVFTLCPCGSSSYFYSAHSSICSVSAKYCSSSPSTETVLETSAWLCFHSLIFFPILNMPSPLVKTATKKNATDREIKRKTDAGHGDVNTAPA